MMKRREFLALAAGAAAFTGLAGTGKKGRILFGACRSSVDDVKAMRELGYDFWEWGAGSAFDPSKDDAWWRKQKDEIALKLINKYEAKIAELLEKTASEHGASLKIKGVSAKNADGNA